MTYKLSSVMKCQRNITFRTFNYLSAAPAGYKAVKASAVYEKHHLLLLTEGPVHGFIKLPGNDAPVAAFKLLPEIDHPDLCQTAHGPVL